jgi:hypothetical protein
MQGGGALTSMSIPVTDVTSQIRMASRIVESNLNEAINTLQSASNAFDNATLRWEGQVRQSEQKLRSERAAGKLKQAKAKHSATKTRIAPVQNLLRIAAQALRDASFKKQELTKRETDSSQADSPDAKPT